MVLFVVLVVEVINFAFVVVDVVVVVDDVEIKVVVIKTSFGIFSIAKVVEKYVIVGAVAGVLSLVKFMLVSQFLPAKPFVRVQFHIKIGNVLKIITF